MGRGHAANILPSHNPYCRPADRRRWLGTVAATRAGRRVLRTAARRRHEGMGPCLSRNAPQRVGASSLGQAVLQIAHGGAVRRHGGLAIAVGSMPPTLRSASKFRPSSSGRALWGELARACRRDFSRRRRRTVAASQPEPVGRGAPGGSSEHRSCPLSSNRQWPVASRSRTRRIVENWRRVASSWERMRAS